jgi:glycerol-3-phosphate dehydrogenase (NAD(P)+)
VSGRVVVIGDGGWGTALALAAHRAGNEVAVWSVDAAYAAEVARTRENRKFLPGVAIPREILWTADEGEAAAGASLALSVVPTQFVRSTLARFAPLLRGVPLFSASKGLERGSLARPTEILREVLGPGARLGAISGPSHAEETARGMATTVVAASEDAALADLAAQRLGSDSLRLYTSEDLAGVELGGALKNIIAVGSGISDGLGLGDNAKAALVARGLVEIARYGAAHGARRETFFGLSGAGDLMVTCYSQHSRNRGLGERIGRGETLPQILASTEKVAEGVWTCQAIHEAAGRAGVSMPITEAVHAVLFAGLAPREAVRGLMQRPRRAEMAE